MYLLVIHFKFLMFYFKRDFFVLSTSSFIALCLCVYLFVYVPVYMFVSLSQLYGQSLLGPLSFCYFSLPLRKIAFLKLKKNPKKDVATKLEGVGAGGCSSFWVSTCLSLCLCECLSLCLSGKVLWTFCPFVAHSIFL